MAGIFRFKRSITKLLSKKKGDFNTSRFVRFDLADLTAISNIQEERQPALQLDINGSPTTDVLTTFTGKPIFTGEPKEMVTLDVTFFLRTGEFTAVARSLGKDLSIMSIGLVRPIDEHTVQTLAIAMINVNQYTTSNLTTLMSTAQDADIANIQNDSDAARRESQGLLFPMRTSLKFDLADVFQPFGRNWENIGTDLKLVFGLFSKSGNDGIGVPVEGSSYVLDYDIAKDLRAYYTVKVPVSISAFASSLDQTLVTIEKPASSNAEKVRIVRRVLRKGRQPGPFQSVKEIDFPADTDTTISESYTETFIDGNPNIDPNNPTGPVDNTVRHQYRAVPIGKNNAPTIVFQDAFTDPITQANFEIGSEFRILPHIQTVDGSLKQTGFSVHDSSLLDPGELLVDAASDVALVSYYNAAGAVTVEISNLGGIAAIDILRRDLSKSEPEFTLVTNTDTAGGSSSMHLTAELDSNSRITYIDSSLIEGHVYEYAVRSYTRTGLVQISDDKTVIQFRDKRLLLDNLQLEVSGPEFQGSSAVLHINVMPPQNITSLVNALLGTRDPSSRQTPFFEDIINNRENLESLFLPVVRRLDLTTGAEREFSSLSLNASKFEDLTPREEGVGLPNVFSFKFTDDTIGPGKTYRYEVVINARFPLTLLPSKVFVKDNVSRPYIFQPAKVQNPIFLQRGVLPPSKSALSENSDFLSARDIGVGPDRLLNRFTQEDPFEVGITAARQVVPAGAPLIIPSQPDFAVLAPTVKKTRQSALELSWSVSGDTSTLDHFKIMATDTYSARNGGRSRRQHVVAFVPAQGATSFSIESKLDRLVETDFRQFDPGTAATGGPAPPMSVLQRLVDEKRVAVTRRFKIIAIFYDGPKRSVRFRSSRPVGIISPLSSRLSATSKVNIPPRYALSPNIALATPNNAERVALKDLERILANLAEEEDQGQKNNINAGEEGGGNNQKAGFGEVNEQKAGKGEVNERPPGAPPMPWWS